MFRQTNKKDKVEIVRPSVWARMKTLADGRDVSHCHLPICITARTARAPHYLRDQLLTLANGLQARGYAFTIYPYWPAGAESFYEDWRTQHTVLFERYSKHIRPLADWRAGDAWLACYQQLSIIMRDAGTYVQENVLLTMCIQSGIEDLEMKKRHPNSAGGDAAYREYVLREITDFYSWMHCDAAKKTRSFLLYPNHLKRMQQVIGCLEGMKSLAIVPGSLQCLQPDFMAEKNQKTDMLCIDLSLLFGLYDTIGDTIGPGKNSTLSYTTIAVEGSLVRLLTILEAIKLRQQREHGGRFFPSAAAPAKRETGDLTRHVHFS